MTTIRNSDFELNVDINFNLGRGSGNGFGDFNLGGGLGPFGQRLAAILDDALGGFDREDLEILENWKDDRANGISDVLNAWRDEVQDRRGNGGDTGAGLVGVADQLGDLANEVENQGLAADINDIESELRKYIADGEDDPEALDALADKIGALANDIDDPELAAKLNDIESDLRAEIDEMTGADDREEALDAVADALGDLVNDVEDQGLAAKINELESRLRRAIADGASDEELDAIADDIGSLVNDIEDQELAGALNDIETDLREVIAAGDTSGAPEVDDAPLEVDGNGTVNTGRYTIEATHNTVRIMDNETGKWIKAWGDPHLHTSDGDKAQFHEDNLTIDLPDGTKVTLQPTEKNDRGLSFVDKVAITKGDEAVVISGVHDNKISNTGVMDGEGAADGVDLSFEDGTVLEVGDELDDLFFTDENGDRLEEMVGEDRSQRFNEWMLDGRGGASDLGAEND
jgi:hypothetical protein